MDFENALATPPNGVGLEQMDDDEPAIMEGMEEDGDAPEMERIDADDDGCARGIIVNDHISRGPRHVISPNERYIEPDYPRLPNEGNLEWQYQMRRTMQEIVPGVYLGPYASATRAKLEEMKAAGLTHIVCVRQDLERNLIRPNHPEHFKYMVVEIADSATENIIPHFRAVNDFINECLANRGRALVHGNAGISRSAALVIAFIMSRYGVTLKEAFSYVQSKRFCCNPNEGFMAQLREYEPIYRAQHTVPIPLPTNIPTRISLKRSFEPEDGDEDDESPSKLPEFNSSSHFHQKQIPNHTMFSSSSESSACSSSESLPHVALPNHNASVTVLQGAHQSDASMSTF